MDIFEHTANTVDKDVRHLEKNNGRLMESQDNEKKAIINSKINEGCIRKRLALVDFLEV